MSRIGIHLVLAAGMALLVPPARAAADGPPSGSGRQGPPVATNFVDDGFTGRLVGDFTYCQAGQDQCSWTRQVTDIDSWGRGISYFVTMQAGSPAVNYCEFQAPCWRDWCRPGHNCVCDGLGCDECSAGGPMPYVGPACDVQPGCEWVASRVVIGPLLGCTESETDCTWYRDVRVEQIVSCGGNVSSYDSPAMFDGAETNYPVPINNGNPTSEICYEPCWTRWCAVFPGAVCECGDDCHDCSGGLLSSRLLTCEP